MSNWALSPAAFDDLCEILDYLEREAGGGAADRLLDRFHHAFDLIAHDPRIGRVREEITGGRVRWWPVHSYLVLYDSEASPVRIVRVIHGARDLESLLRTR